MVPLTIRVLPISRTIELVVRDGVGGGDHHHPLEMEAYQRLVKLALEELTSRSTEQHSPLLQNHALEILVAIGSQLSTCPMVVEALMSHAKDKTMVQHFMVMQCLGRLASSNVQGMLPFVHSILSTILVSLGAIRHDPVKQAYAYGK